MSEPMQSKGDGNRPTDKLGSTIHFGVFAFMLAVTMPRLVRSFSPAWDVLDTSWAWMLGHALQHHLQWGVTILFTYGPLGFLTHPYFYSDHTLWSIAATIRLTAWLLLGLGYACVLRRLVPDSRPFPRVTLPAAIGWVIGAHFLHLSAQSAFVGVLLLVLAIAEEQTVIVIVALVLSGFLLALGALIKSTALIVSLFALLVYPALWYAGNCNRAPILSLLPLASFAVFFCALWKISFQSLSNLPTYLRGTWAIARGYTPAMSIPGRPLPEIAALLILTVFAAVLIALLVRRKTVLVTQCLLLGGVAFWAWKEGFTRQDWGYFRHPMAFFGTALLIAAVGTVLLSQKNTRRVSIGVYGAYAVALLFSLRGYPLLSLSYRNVLDNYDHYATLIASKSHRTAEQHSETLAIRRQFHLPHEMLQAIGNASANVIPWSLMMAQGYGIHLIASPVIQSYSAYTPYLDRMNSRQIWNGKGAEKIIYAYRSLDRRYPAFDEPATFRAILSCYKTGYAGHPYAVLSRGKCAPPHLVALGRPRQSAFGAWIKVPSQATYADIFVRTTAIGHVMDILFKPREVWIYFKLADGSVKGPYRFIYPVAQDGLYVRYFIDSQSAVDSLFSGSFSDLHRVAAIEITTHSDPLDYAKFFDVRFFKAKPPHGHRILAAAAQGSAGELLVP